MFIPEINLARVEITDGCRHSRPVIDFVGSSQIEQTHVLHQGAQPRAVAETKGQLVLHIGILG